MNAIQALARQTLTAEDQWDEIDGPASGVGTDHWFRHRSTGAEAYVNEDQGEFRVEICDQMA